MRQNSLRYYIYITFFATAPNSIFHIEEMKLKIMRLAQMFNVTVDISDHSKTTLCYFHVFFSETPFR